MKARSEASIEREFKLLLAAGLKHMGVLSVKFTPEGQRGWQDRLVFLPGGVAAFIEFKRPGAKPRKGEELQRYRSAQLRKLGFPVLQTDNAQDAINWINRL